MEPSEFATTLRRIASAIDASEKPNQALVTRDLQKLITAAKDEEEPPEINWSAMNKAVTDFRSKAADFMKSVKSKDAKVVAETFEAMLEAIEMIALRGMDMRDLYTKIKKVEQSHFD